MTTPTIADAIRELNTIPTAFSIDNGKIIAWDVAEEKTGIPQPTDAEIQAEVTRLQAEYDNNQYQRDRQYASTGDQLDMLWHSIDAGEFGDTAKQSEFYTANKAVKDANPKG
jgi:hypothetical protein